MALLDSSMWWPPSGDIGPKLAPWRRGAHHQWWALSSRELETRLHVMRWQTNWFQLVAYSALNWLPTSSIFETQVRKPPNCNDLSHQLWATWQNSKWQVSITIRQIYCKPNNRKEEVKLFIPGLSFSQVFVGLTWLPTGRWRGGLLSIEMVLVVVVMRVGVKVGDAVTIEHVLCTGCIIFQVGDLWCGTRLTDVDWWHFGRGFERNDTN